MPKRETYRDSEILSVLHAAPPTEVGRRDRLAIRLLWVAGLKPAELLALRPGDVVAGHVYVDDREIAVQPHQVQMLTHDLLRWMGDRGTIVPARRSSTAPLLCNQQGDELDASYLRHAIANMSAAAGLPRPLNAKGLRNTFAAEQRAAGLPLEQIQRQLGLATIEYTAAYVATLSESTRTTSR